MPHGKTTMGHAFDIFLQFMPIALFIIGGKLATYLSYAYVSMALTHTAKALEPVFNVTLSALFFAEFKPVGVYLSLIPIALGVAVASTTELSYNVRAMCWSRNRCTTLTTLTCAAHWLCSCIPVSSVEGAVPHCVVVN